MKKVLVTGGAGYIGSHMVRRLLDSGHNPIVVDDLSTGNASTVPPDVPLHIFNIENKEKLNDLFASEPIEAVMHFAASTDVGESVKHPQKYYENNVTSTLNLLNCMHNHTIEFCVFSSTAAIFGEAKSPLIDENHPINPINPYGRSKAMCEQILKDFATAYGIKFISLRYFNAAGADALHRVKPQNKMRKNLIPLILEVARGQSDCIEVFGRDYPTPDGTCIRDYIHVMDLCQAHLLALESLFTNRKSGYYNLGNGRGYSVQEVINSTQEITKKNVRVIDGKRRPGDSPVVIADTTLAQQELGWHPQFPDIGHMILHDWEWGNHFTN